MLIEYLHLFNDKFHGLYAKHLRAIAELTKISMSEVYEVASMLILKLLMMTHYHNLKLR